MRRLIELVAIVVAVAVSQVLPGPARWANQHQGINVLLAILVFSTAMTIPRGATARLGVNRVTVAVVLLATTVVLPALSWAAAQAVSPAALRKGVVVIGLAPAEIASVATTSIGGGDSAAAAALLVGSTIVTVVLAGPLVALLAGGSGVHPIGILVNLAVVVAAPLAAGLAFRTAVPIGTRAETAAGRVAVAAVTLLVGVIAAQVNLTGDYLGVAVAILLFMVGSVLLGTVLARGAPRPLATALLLTTSMRDFAIGAGIATAAFGPTSAGPLGLYGVLVIVWGMALATTRRRSPGAPHAD